ncbi:hypothetical protein D3C87_1673370 [compost metagenome]
MGSAPVEPAQAGHIAQVLTEPGDQAPAVVAVVLVERRTPADDDALGFGQVIIAAKILRAVEDSLIARARIFAIRLGRRIGLRLALTAALWLFLRFALAAIDDF